MARTDFPFTTFTGLVLDVEQEKRVSVAVKAARDAANQLAKRIERDGEEAAKVIREQNMAAVEMARFAFLDIAEMGERKTEREPAAQRALDTEVTPVVVSKQHKTTQLELEPTKRGRKGRAA